jgi:hypothetical protein
MYLMYMYLFHPGAFLARQRKNRRSSVDKLDFPTILGGCMATKTGRHQK